MQLDEPSARGLFSSLLAENLAPTDREQKVCALIKFQYNYNNLPAPLGTLSISSAAAADDDPSAAAAAAAEFAVNISRPVSLIWTRFRSQDDRSRDGGKN